MIEAAFTFLLVVGVAFSMQGYVEDYIAEETTDLRADRVENAAKMLQYYPEGTLELDLGTNYQFQVAGNTFEIRYDETPHERDLGYLNYDNINGPSDFETFSSLCLQKQNNELHLEEEC